MAFSVPPVQITAALTDYAVAGNGMNQFYGPFRVSGALYLVTRFSSNAPFPEQILAMNKSVDNGLSWSIVDGASAPVGVFYGAALIGTDIIIPVVQTAPNNPPTTLNGCIFHTASDAWGLVSTGPSVPGTTLITGCQARTTDVLVLYSGLNLIPNTYNAFAIPFDGLTFGAAFAIDTGFAHKDNIPTVTSTVDASGRVHIFQGISLDGVYYRSVEASNVVNAFVLFTDVDSLGTGNPAVNNLTDTIVFPSATASAQPVVKIGTPLSSPVWSAPVSIDTPPGGVGVAGNAALIGAEMRVIYISNDSASEGVGTGIRDCRSTDLITWTADYGYDGLIPPIPQLPGGGYNSLGASDDGAGQLAVGITAFDDVTGFGIGFYATGAPGAPLVFSCVPSNGIVGISYSSTCPASGGSPPYVYSTPGPLPPGLVLDPATDEISGVPTVPGTFPFDLTVTDALGASITLSVFILILPATSVQSESGGGPFVMPRPCPCDVNELVFQAIQEFQARKNAWPYPYSFRPPGAIRVTVQSTIPVPAVLAGETLGLAYTVDEGYLFALESIVVEFLAGGFVGAANPGDFLWSLDLNKPVGVGSFQGSTVQGFRLVDVILGSHVLPWPLECPEILSPNDTLRAKFFNVALIDGVPNAFKTIFLGWRWPVR